MIQPQYQPYLVNEIATTDEHPTNHNLTKEIISTFNDAHSRKSEYEQGMKTVSHSYAKDYCLRMCKARLAITNEKEDEKLLNLLDLSLDKVSGAVQEVAGFNNIDFVTKHAFLIIQGAVVAYLGQEALRLIKKGNFELVNIVKSQYEKENEDYQVIFKELKPKNDLKKIVEEALKNQQREQYEMMFAKPPQARVITATSEPAKEQQIVSVPLVITSADPSKLNFWNQYQDEHITYDPSWIDGQNYQSEEYKPLNTSVQEIIEKYAGVDVGNQPDSIVTQILTTKHNEDLTYIANAISAYGTDEQKKKRTEQALNFFKRMPEIQSLFAEINQLLGRPDGHKNLLELKDFREGNPGQEKNVIVEQYIEYLKEKRDEIKDLTTTPTVNQPDINSLAKTINSEKFNELLSKMEVDEKMATLEKVADSMMNSYKKSSIDYLVEDSKFRKERNAKVINGETKSAFHRHQLKEELVKEVENEIQTLTRKLIEAGKLNAKEARKERNKIHLKAVKEIEKDGLKVVKTSDAEKLEKELEEQNNVTSALQQCSAQRQEQEKQNSF